MTHQLRTMDEGYPYLFFTEKAFHREQVTNYITGRYIDLAEYFSERDIFSLGDIQSHAVDLFKLGVFARISVLEESMNEGFMWDESMDVVVRQFCEETNGDLMRAVERFEKFYSTFPMNPTYRQLFEHDIQKALDTKKVFHFSLDIPFDSLWYFAHKISKDADFDGHPLAPENINRTLRHIPLIRVW